VATADLTRRNLMDILHAQSRSPTTIEVARLQRYFRGPQRCIEYDALTPDLRDFVNAVENFVKLDLDLSTLYND